MSCYLEYNTLVSISVSSSLCKFYRLYSGSTPMLVTTDAEWLKEAWIKHFRVFTNRRRLRFGGAFDHGLFSIEGDHWRHVRQKLSPEFSSGKLKKVSWVQCCICIKQSYCFSTYWLRKWNEFSLSVFGGSPGPQPLRISLSLGMAEFSVKSFTLFIWWRVFEAFSPICYLTGYRFYTATASNSKYICLLICILHNFEPGPNTCLNVITKMLC